MTERLQKILAARGVASRRASEKLVEEGRVTVNGRVALLGDKADPDHDEICLDGKPLPPALSAHTYLLLYKPAGYITSVTDPRGRRTVLDLVRNRIPAGGRLYPVGRLDYATSGVLLLTDDGDLTNALLHPGREIDKTYESAVMGEVTAAKLKRLAGGVRLSDGLTAPAKVRQKRREAGKSTTRTVLELTIHEGRNRQVRRMLAAVGLDVIWLKRTSFAGLSLSGLKPGECRELTGEELTRLLQYK